MNLSMNTEISTKSKTLTTDVAFVSLDPRMNGKMVAKCIRLGEALVTDLARVLRPVAGVGAQVDLQVAFQGEALAATFALVRLLPRVDDKVVAQALPSSEPLAADVTLVRPRARVRASMHLQVALEGERLAADLALVRFPPGVNYQMVAQHVGLRECFAALPALVRPFAGVHPGVDLQVTLVGKALPAFTAGEALPVTVGANSRVMIAPAAAARQTRVIGGRAVRDAVGRKRGRRPAGPGRNSGNAG